MIIKYISKNYNLRVAFSSRCVQDMRKEMGRVVASIHSIIMAGTMFLNSVFYGLVWFKIKQVTKNTNTLGTSTKPKYSRSASIMIKFVAAYILQWSSNVIFLIWSQIQMPPFVMVHLVVFTVNLGGLFNLVAYTLGRRMGSGGNRNITRTNDNITSSSSSTRMETISHKVE